MDMEKRAARYAYDNNCSIEDARMVLADWDAADACETQDAEDRHQAEYGE